MNTHHRRLALAGAIALSGLTLGALPATADVTAQTCEFPRVISIGNARAYEGTGAGTTTLAFTVDGNGGCYTAASVHYDIAAGTAGDTDLTAGSGTVSWASDDTGLKTISVPVTRDALDEANETFSVILSPVSGWTDLADNTGTGTILDDDGTPTWNVDDAACSEGNSGTHSCAFTISLSTPKQSGSLPTVLVSASNGTAGSADYTAFSNQLVALPLGQSAITQNVTIKGDTVCEGDETVKLTLSSPSAGTALADSQAIVTIQNDDIFCS
ncbi:Calx-beta domain-containing protein [Actinosynnema sp. NPDC051121]|nr:hypothetical protein [Saccharothrix sp.]